MSDQINETKNIKNHSNYQSIYDLNSSYTTKHQ